MCVTNIAKRRNAALSTSPDAVSRTPSLISQRLLGSSLASMLKTPKVSEPLHSTVSTYGPVGIESRVSGMPLMFDDDDQSPYIETPQEKKHPKRRRKPQMPGMTAKQNERHFVIHDYHDHAWDPDECDVEEDHRRRGGVSVSFPTRLHNVIDQVERDGWSHVISWQPHGRCFLIHKPNEFQRDVMPAYFGQSKLTSFQRQLNLYGFSRLTRGNDAGAYYHELFLRGKAFLTKKMLRTKIKGTKFKASSNPEQEPDFYRMPPVRAVSDDSSYEESTEDQSRVGSELNPITSRPEVLSLASNVVDIEPLPFSFSQVPYRHHAGPGPYYGVSMQGIMNQGVLASGTAQVHSSASVADDFLDQAADALFKDADNIDFVEMQPTGDFSGNWETASFGRGAREDDLQLGFMLDFLLKK